MKKIDWTSHFIELIVVFIGITAAFLLNNWRESRAEQKLELKYYSSLLKDLTDDSDALDDILSFGEHQDSVLGKFITRSIDDNFPKDSISNILIALVSISQFSAEMGTYETIKYSGNLDVFSDYELREEINSYYNKVDEAMVKQKLHSNFINSYCIPFIYKKVDIIKGKFRPGVTIDIEFNNIVVGYKALLDQDLGAFQDLMKENMDLKLKLAKKIGG